MEYTCQCDNFCFWYFILSLFIINPIFMK